MKERSTQRKNNMKTFHWKVFTVSVPLLFVFFKSFSKYIYSIHHVFSSLACSLNVGKHFVYHYSKRSSIVFDRDHFIANRNNSLFNNNKRTASVHCVRISVYSFSFIVIFPRLNSIDRGSLNTEQNEEKMKKKKFIKWKTSKMTSSIYQWCFQFNDINEDIISVFLMRRCLCRWNEK